MLRTGLLFLAALLMTEGAARAQNLAPVSVYYELLGNGGMYTVNVDARLRPDLAVRAGVGYWDDWLSATGYTATGSYIRGKRSEYVELGLGFTVIDRHEDYTADSPLFASLTGILGYRYQRRQGGVLFRFGYTPFLSLTGDESAFPHRGILHWFGLSLGYTIPWRPAR